MSSAYWSPERAPIDSVIVAGKKLPGFSEPAGAASPRKIQKQAGPGFSGARYLFLGMGIVEFSILIHLQDDADWEELDEFIRSPVGSFLTPPTPKSGGPLNQQSAVINPYTIYHPFLAMLGIAAVIVDDVKQPVRDGDTGGWMIEVKVTKYSPLKLASATYDKPKGDAPDERDQRNLAKAAENAQKRAQLDALQSTPLPAPK